MDRTNVEFFKTKADLRKWFKKNHLTASELILGYFKKATKKASVDWSESVDEAICYGWIDGIRRKIDEESYCIRFTPRRARSHWSRVNIEKAHRLTKEKLMAPEGIKAFEKMDPKNAEQFTYETIEEILLDSVYESEIRANKKAWTFYQNLAPGYKRTSIHWVMRAKREETRLRRLRVLIESSAEGLKIPGLRKK